MKGHVYRRGRAWSYIFDIDPDPLTGKRRQASGSGFATEKAAWRACRTALKEYEDGQRVQPSKRTVEDALNDWLTRIRHSVKPSMWQNWQNYADYYVIPHIGQRKAQEIDGAVLDALYARLLAEGRRRTDKNSLMYDYWLANPDARAADLVKSCGVTIYAARAALPGSGAAGNRRARGKVWRRRLSSTFTASCIAPGRTLKPGSGFTGTSPKTLTRRLFPGRAARSGPSCSCAPSSTTPGPTGSIPCGCWRRHRACGGASWPGHAATGST